LDDERLLTGPEPGLTRDAVAVGWEWRGRRIELIDTAGLRRRARIEPGALEELSSKSALAALRQADVVVLMVDASAPLEQQDVTIANRAAEAGRAVVVAANKWDLVEEPEAALALLRERLESRLPHLKGIACLPISVRTGKNLDRLLQLVFETYDRWSKRIGTGPLNRWLAEAIAAHPPPMAKGRRVKIRYATQVGTRPPTFVLFVSQAGALPETYLRYLTNSLREAFGVPGVPTPPSLICSSSVLGGVEDQVVGDVRRVVGGSSAAAVELSHTAGDALERVGAAAHRPRTAQSLADLGRVQPIRRPRQELA